jgi:hypothetical protein
VSTFLQLQAAFYARGYDYMNDGGVGQTAAKTFLNQSYLELCEEELWPFLLTTATGAPPLLVTDLRSLFTVTDTVSNVALRQMSEDELRDDFPPLLTTTGTPSWFYVTDVTVNTYPVGGSLSVRYWRVPAELAADADVAIIPNRFCNLIVDGAVRRAGAEDAPAAAAAAEAERQRGIDLMRRSVMFRDGTRHHQRITGASGDW